MALTVPNAISQMAKFYTTNIHTYGSMQTLYPGDDNIGKCQHDCMGFVSACLRAAGIFPKGVNFATENWGPNGGASKYLLKSGVYQYLAFTSGMVLSPCDILAVFEGRGNGLKHHVEIYAGNNTAWSWGKVYPNLPKKFYANNRWQHVWKYTGGDNMANSTNTNNTSSNTDNNTDAQPTQTTNNQKEIVDPNKDAGNVFENSYANAYSNILTTEANPNVRRVKHTRIYALFNSSIVLDSLSEQIEQTNQEAEFDADKIIALLQAVQNKSQVESSVDNNTTETNNTSNQSQSEDPTITPVYNIDNSQKEAILSKWDKLIKKYQNK